MSDWLGYGFEIPAYEKSRNFWSKVGGLFLQRQPFHVLLFVYKALNGMVPGYITDLIAIKRHLVDALCDQMIFLCEYHLEQSLRTLLIVHLLSLGY